MPNKPSLPHSDLLRQELNALRDAVARSKDAASGNTAELPRLPRQARKSKPAKIRPPHPDKTPP